MMTLEPGMDGRVAGIRAFATPVIGRACVGCDVLQCLPVTTPGEGRHRNRWQQHHGLGCRVPIGRLHRIDGFRTGDLRVHCTPVDPQHRRVFAMPHRPHRRQVAKQPDLAGGQSAAQPVRSLDTTLPGRFAADGGTVHEDKIHRDAGGDGTGDNEARQGCSRRTIKPFAKRTVATLGTGAQFVYESANHTDQHGLLSSLDEQAEVEGSAAHAGFDGHAVGGAVSIVAIDSSMKHCCCCFPRAMRCGPFQLLPGCQCGAVSGLQDRGWRVEWHCQRQWWRDGRVFGNGGAFRRGAGAPRAGRSWSSALLGRGAPAADLSLDPAGVGLLSRALT